MEKRKYRHKPTITFFVILVLAVLPLLVIPFVSANYHEIFNCPSVNNGVLDLKDYDLQKGFSIPLDGEWEFFYDKLIVTDHLRDAQPDYLAKVPLPWNRYFDQRLHNIGKGSYRILLKNCPKDIELFSGIENISSRYRIYINGVLVSGRGDMNVQGIEEDYPDDAITQNPYAVAYRDGVVAEHGTAVLVVEIVGNHVGGLYIAPTLSELGRAHAAADIHNMTDAGIVGVLIIFLGSFIGLYKVKDKTLPTLSLLLMDLLVFVKICFQNNYFYIFRKCGFYREYALNTLLEVVVIFLPLIFLLCVQKLLNIKIKGTLLKAILIYELIFAPFIFWTAFSGWVQIKVYICMLAYLPFLIIIVRLYHMVRERVPHALVVSAILMILLTSVITSTAVRTGSVVMDISLFPPICFTLSMIFQLVLYVQRNLEMQNQAMEAENLQLRLKESQLELMMSQIKPHFLYNTLIAIHMLCTEEPETAAETVLKFAAFLRTNMNYISSKEPIPFKKELEHIRNYADIEQLRFHNRLEIRYDIQTEDFVIPPLTIQPLVENGIRHGACKNIEKGVLILKTVDTEDGICIEIIDNGPGFDTQTIDLESKEPHGIQNVVFRLKQFNAKIVFESQPDKGCIVRVHLPKEELS